MMYVSYSDPGSRETVDALICALHETLDMLKSKSANRDIEVSGFVSPEDGHGSLVIHLGELY